MNRERRVIVSHRGVEDAEKNMCDLCTEEEMAGCQDCGCLICFDVDSGDDVIRRAYVTAAGDLVCDKCGRERDRAEEELDDNYLPITDNGEPLNP